MISNKRHALELKKIHEAHEQELAKLNDVYAAALALEYDRARVSLAAQLKALLLDYNYDVFNGPDALLRSRTYRFISEALNEFNERAIKNA
jgi:hypothetical protein